MLELIAVVVLEIIMLLFIIFVYQMAEIVILPHIIASSGISHFPWTCTSYIVLFGGSATFGYGASDFQNNLYYLQKHTNIPNCGILKITYFLIILETISGNAQGLRKISGLCQIANAMPGLNFFIQVLKTCIGSLSYSQTLSSLELF